MTNLADLADLTPIQVWDGVVARRVQGEQLTLAVVELGPDAIVPSHRHANEQCGLVIEGEVTFRIGDEERVLGPGGTWRSSATRSTRSWRVPAVRSSSMSSRRPATTGMTARRSARTPNPPSWSGLAHGDRGRAKGARDRRDGAGFGGGAQTSNSRGARGSRPRLPRTERPRDQRRMKEPSRNPYAELGADVDADRRTIRGAYLAKARSHHPDLGGEVRAMARINEAFELLNDPLRRAAYDARHATSPGREKAHAPSWTGAAGSPPGRPSGPVLDFGIFAGWSLGEIARTDPGYLVWLTERKEGRPYLADIERHLGPLRRQSGKPQTQRRAYR
jgi:hypothetical protein